MKGLLLVVRRELGAYAFSLWGWAIVAAILVVDGLLFNAFALGAGARYSTEVLQQFFYFSFGTTVIAGILLTMRLNAEERQTGTMRLLDASPLTDWQIVAGKWLSAVAVLSVMTLSTLYMPALIFVNGKVSVGHIAAGYLGLLLVGSATAAVGTFASTLTRSQLVAGVVAAILTVFLLITWLLAKIAAPPFDGIFAYMAMFNDHFSRTFMRGEVVTDEATAAQFDGVDSEPREVVEGVVERFAG